MNLQTKILIFFIVLLSMQQRVEQYDDDDYSQPENEVKTKQQFLKDLPLMRSKFIHRSLIGTWKLTQDSNFNLNKKTQMVNELSNKNQQYGPQINFINNKNSNEKQAQTYLQVNQQGLASKFYIQLYNGKYYDDDTVVLELDVLNLNGSKKGDLNKNTNLWQTMEKKFVVCRLIRNRELLAKVSISTDYFIYTNIQPDQRLSANSRLTIELSSKTFKFNAQFKPITDQYIQLVKFSMLFTLIFILVTIYNIKNPLKSVYNISEFMIIQATFFILLANFELIYTCLQKIDTKLQIVIICGILNIIASLFFLRNYEGVFKNYYQIDRTHNQSNRLTVRRSLLINRFAIMLSFVIGYIVLFYLFSESHNFWIYESYILISLQIYYSYSVGGKGGISYLLLLHLIASRFPYFYYKFNSQVLTREYVNVGQLLQFCVVNIVLVMFTLLQKIFGSRFIVPKELIPFLHQYVRKYSKDDEIMNEECSVCLEKLKDKSALNHQPEEKQDQEQMEDEYDNAADDSIVSSSDTVPPHATAEKQHNQAHGDKIQKNKSNKVPVVSQPSMSEIVQFQIQVMMTPCRHRFHTECLVDWMQQKLTCPNCRTDLPPSEKQRDQSYCF